MGIPEGVFVVPNNADAPAALDLPASVNLDDLDWIDVGQGADVPEDLHLYRVRCVGASAADDFAALQANWTQITSANRASLAALYQTTETAMMYPRLASAGLFSVVFVTPTPETAPDWPWGKVPENVQHKRIYDIGDFRLWQVYAAESILMDIHDWLWATAPVKRFGALAAVQTFGSTFYASAVSSKTDKSFAQFEAQRDAMANYIDTHGGIDTTDLRAAETEHALMAGITTAFGYSLTALWNQMIAVG